MNSTPYRWQSECLDAWISKGCRGIAHVVTGAGKTRLAMMAVEHLQKKSELPLSTIVVVPTCALMEQWIRELKSFFGDGHRIARVGGGFRGGAEAEFQVMVVNTARNILPQRRNALLAENRAVFLICDECHHYGSQENRRIFSGVSLKTAGYYTLGLSATPYCAWFHNVLEPALGEVVCRYGHESALKDDIIAPFIIEQIAVSFNAEEKQEYSVLSLEISLLLQKLFRTKTELGELSPSEFFSACRKLRDSGDELTERLAYLLIKRKKLVLLADSRIRCVCELADILPDDSRVIIFCERISQADALYAALEEKYRHCMGKYHSGRAKEQNRSDMRRFKSGEIRIMLACKSLDEGIDVPEADIAVVVSGTAMNRQHIQRLGRILRRSVNGEKTGILYYLYVKQSSEERRYLPELSENIREVDLRYSCGDGFSCREYEDAAVEVLERLKNRGADESQIREARECILAGLALADWKRSPEYCAERAAESPDTHTENYWRCMGWMSKANKDVNIISERKENI